MPSSELKGKIFNIQPYSVHDGPGIRETIFMKGCPLHCIWCSNPESQSFDLQISYRANKCIGCGWCINKCPQSALSKAPDGSIVRDDEACIRCFRCAQVCCSKAIHVFGESCTVDEIYRRTQPQGAWRTNGGITVSGGEPLAQAEFVARLLARFRRSGTHTAIETTAYAPWQNVEKVLAHCDLVYCDMKFFSETKHKKYTGVSNALIKENLMKMKVAFPELELIVRTPVIPGVNDDDEELEAIATFLSGVPGLNGYELLAFHSYATPKYTQLGLDYAMKDVASPDKEALSERNRHLCKLIGLKS